MTTEARTENSSREIHTAEPRGMSASQGPSPEESEAAAGRLVQILNDGAIGILSSIGHQLGLFEVLATLPPSSCTQVADAAGLNERYVREWLDGVTTAGLVEYDPMEKTYGLRPAYVPFVTGASPDNLARTFQLVTMMGEVTPKVVSKFRSGGGLTYDDYPHFHEVQAADSGAVHDAALIGEILPLTGEVDRLRAGIDVVDLACGQGHAVNLMAREFPRSHFTGLDFIPAAIEAARSEAKSWGLDNARFEVCDIAQAPEPASYDLITVFDAIHDQAQPFQVLENTCRALRPGGTFLMTEFTASSQLEKNVDLPWATFLYAVSTLHCLSVSLGQDGIGLGTAWGNERAEQAVRDAGYHDVVQHHLPADPFNTYFVARV